MKSVHYRMCMVSRIGQVADELFSLVNVFPPDQYKLSISCFPVKELNDVNHAYFEMVTRDIEILENKDMTFLKAYQDENHNEGLVEDSNQIDVRISPMQLRLMCITSLLKGTPPRFFSLIPEEEQRGREIEKSLGISADQPLVTIHVRDGGMFKDMPHHDYRNADIHHYLPAIKHLLSRGYAVVRLGDPQSKKLEPMEGLVDAPFHPNYESFFDPYFVSRSRFYIGMPSGPSSCATSFGIPVLYTDAPLQRINWHLPKDLWIFKKLYSETEKRFLTYEEIICGEAVKYFASSQYEERGWNVINNSPEEILEAVKEMEMRLDGTYRPEPVWKQIESHIKSIQGKAHHIAKSENFFYCYFFHKFDISHSYIKMNPSLFGMVVK